MAKDLYIIGDSAFPSSDYGSEAYLSDWPMLYILEDGRHAYIGQSTDVRNRMLQHSATPGKEIFDHVHFIYCDHFNQSVTFDYESKLIQFFSADGKYVLTNKNGGLFNKNYYDKGKYDKRFDQLWRKLLEKQLADHTLKYLQNSEFFKYSPYKALNNDQREIANDIVNILCDCNPTPIIIHGLPGTGKTILAVYLIKYIKDYQADDYGEKIFKNKKIGLVIPQTALRTTIKKLFRNIEGLSPDDVIGPGEVVKQKYDILLVDEAHRLHKRKNITNYRDHDKNNMRLGLSKDATELDWILSTCDMPVLFFDNNQVIGPSGINASDVKDLFLKTRGIDINEIPHFHLKTEMRVEGGEDYIQYVLDILNNNVKEKMLFDNYEFCLCDSFADFNRLLYEKENKYGLCRMVAGYAWPWKSKDDKSLVDMTIEGITKQWNYKTQNWINIDHSIDQVGCIHSIQGYDLNYCFVILGNDISFDKERKTIIINEKSYFDQKGKNTATKEELTEYIKNIYYVLMTRGIKGTYLYICDEGLREYIKQYVGKIV